MASKRKAAKRVSGVKKRNTKKNPLVFYGSIVAGYFVGDKITAAIVKVAPTMDTKIIAGAEIGAGIVAKKYMKGMAGEILGGVLIGAGAKGGLKAFGVVSGFRDLHAIAGNEQIAGRRRMGYPLPMTSAYKNSSMSVVSGMPNEGSPSGNGNACAMN